MGLSSSQARLLSLTGRMHQIEYGAQKLEAQKLQLANETRQVYADYENALEMTKIQHKILNTDGSVTFKDTTFNNFIYSQARANSIYILRDTESGRVYVPNKIRSAYENSNKTIDGFLKTLDSLNEDKSSYTSITSAEQLSQLSSSNGKFKLDADLVLDNWEGIRNFSGTFDGNGHTITIKSGTSGLFRSTNGTTLKNIELDVNIKNPSSGNDRITGGICGSLRNSTVDNCSVKGALHGTRNIGGAFGSIVNGCNISNCDVDVDVYSDFVSTGNGKTPESEWDGITYAGGFAGRMYGGNKTITNCIARGNVSGEYGTMGGFIGSVNNGSFEITNCIAEGNITPNRSGLMKDFDGSRIQKYNNYCGTFIAEYTNAATGTVNNCIATGLQTNAGVENITMSDYGYDLTQQTRFATNNSYSTFAGDNIPETKTIATSSDVNPANYPNIPADEMDNYINMFNILNNAGGGIKVDDKVLDDSRWFTNMVNNGFAIIATVDMNKGFEITDTSVATDTNLQEVQDETKLRKAEAQYEADMKRIDMKDRKYDYDLAALDNERNAIKQEMETLQTVAKDNVERTFKLFS